MANRKYQERERGKSRKKKRRKKKSHKIYAFFVLLLGFVIIIVAVLVLFYVQKIKVSGNEYTTEQEIVESVQNDKYSINTLYILGKYALGKGEVLPCLERMKIRMESPWSLKVIVEEKPVIGYIQNGDKYSYFDKEGLVVYESPVLMEGLPYIEGIDVGEIKLYQQLKSDDTKIFGQILETSKEVTKYGLSTAKIVCEGENICLDIGKVRVSLGKAVSAEQIAQIAPILEKLGDREGVLHLENYSGMKGTVTFEEAATPADPAPDVPEEPIAY